MAGGQREEKKEWRLAHLLLITASLVKQNGSPSSLRALGACPSPLPPPLLPSPPPLLPVGEAEKKEKKKQKPEDFPSLSLWLLGVPFLISWTRNRGLSWSYFCRPLGHTSEFLAAFESRLGNTRGKKWQTHCWLSGTLNPGLLPQSACYNLCLRALRELLPPFCPGFRVAFSVPFLILSFVESASHLNHWSFAMWKMVYIYIYIYIYIYSPPEVAF